MICRDRLHGGWVRTLIDRELRVRHHRDLVHFEHLFFKLTLLSLNLPEPAVRYEARLKEAAFDRGLGDPLSRSS